MPSSRAHCVILAALTTTLCGCATYTTPGPAADMSLFGGPANVREQQTDSPVQAALDRKPLASFPATIALARVQGSGYTNWCTTSYGSGRYSIVTTMDVEKEDDLARLRRLPMVRDVGVMNGLLLPGKLETGAEVRSAAAALHADMVLVYTFDTRFTTDDFASPLTLVTLGLFPSKNVKLNTSGSAVLIDTRNGYVYGTLTGSSKQSQLANSWTSESAADDSRKRAERDAFEQMLTGLERMWPGVVANTTIQQQAANNPPVTREPWQDRRAVDGWNAPPPGPQYGTPSGRD